MRFGDHIVGAKDAKNKENLDKHDMNGVWRPYCRLNGMCSLVLGCYADSFGASFGLQVSLLRGVAAKLV